MDERDRFGDKLRNVEKAREDQWAADRDRELLVKLRRQADERATAEPVEKRTGKVFRRILCPVDFEEGSFAALDLAKRLAVQNDADLDVLHVRTGFAVPARRGVSAEIETEQTARRKFEAVAAQHLADVRYQFLLMTGTPAERVSEVQSTLGHDLIVMGTHGRRGVPRFFLGSVADRVLREAHCPVLTTMAEPAGHSSIFAKTFNRILCPIDFEESSLKALDLAGRLASQYAAELFLLHVCPTIFVPLGGAVTDRAMAEESAKQKIEAVAAQHLGDVHYQVLITTGDPAERASTIRSALDVDLIVMGTHGRRAVSHFFLGSIAERVVREAACPVITIRQ